jgi:hypothetical protein
MELGNIGELSADHVPSWIVAHKIADALYVK